VRSALENPSSREDGRSCNEAVLSILDGDAVCGPHSRSDQLQGDLLHLLWSAYDSPWARCQRRRCASTRIGSGKRSRGNLWDVGVMQLD
jgi:hypothetical protein